MHYIATPAVRTVRFFIGVGVLATLALLSSQVCAQPLPDEFFSDQIKPILTQHCVQCHSGPKPKGELNLTTHDAFVAGGESGPVVDSESAELSNLLSAVKFESFEMPPTGQLPETQIALIQRWIEAGAPWPNNEVIDAPKHHATPTVNEVTRQFWSFRPIRRPDVPMGDSTDDLTSNHPIDRFIFQGLKEAGLQPNGTADRRTLIRRAHYDLLGLPPTPAQVTAFVNDPAADAFEKLIDELLASPHYGEKWGRHWLDLVRFAETNSYERDAAKPHAWRYRDYVIDSFNQDKPYDLFIREQLAGDEMAPWNPDQIVATGFLRLGIWDDEPADEKQALYDDLDDIMATTSQVFLGLTVNCARCHDHKLDPISQRDYYNLLSFFAGVQRFGGPGRNARDFQYARASIADPKTRESHKQQLEQYQENIQSLRDEMGEMEQRVKKVLVGGEIDDFEHEQNRLAIIRKNVPDKISLEVRQAYERLRKEVKRLEKSPPPSGEEALAVTTVGPQPRDMFVLARGNPHAETDPVSPQFLEILGGQTPEIELPEHGKSSGRRKALANWIASPENPLTARVLANRIWQHHFGRGIVESSNNFGLQGDAPTHPELIDWLAAELIDGGWRMKSLHRTIMLSKTWQMSSAHQATAAAVDPDNRLRWRFEMRRLTAEEIRDSLLAVNESLNLKMGGPSIYTEIPAEVLAGQSRPGEGWGKSSPADAARRSVYIFIKRSLVDPLIANFDGADTDFTCPVRFETTIPTQCLSFVNGKFVHDQAKTLAAASAKHHDGLSDRVTWILHRVMQRTPEPAEIDRGLELIKNLQSERETDLEAAIHLFAVVALNLNEFVYLD